MKRLLVGALSFACCMGANMSVAQQSAVWCVGESTKVKPGDAPQDRNLTWNGATKTVTLGSARNEYVAFQIAIRSVQDELKDVTVVAGDLKGPGTAVIPAANVDLFVEHYLNVKVTSRGDPEHINPGATAGEHPTQMVPFQAKKYGAPFAVGAGRNQPVWADIYVPEDAKPGDYTGTFQAKAGAKVISEIKVALTVWKFMLPQETHFRTYLYTGPENLRWGHHLTVNWDDPSVVPLYDAYFQMAHQHRLNFHPLGGTGLEEVLVKYYKYYDGSAFTNRVGKVSAKTSPVSPRRGRASRILRIRRERLRPPARRRRSRRPSSVTSGTSRIRPPISPNPSSAANGCTTRSAKSC